MRNYLEIDLNRLEHNLNVLLQKTTKDKIVAVIKANAYGHGAVPVFKKLRKLGITHFGVATYDEALEIHQIDKKVYIHIFGIIDDNDYEKIQDTNIRVTVSNKKTLEYLYKNKLRNKIHIKVDTGMTRLGFDKSNLQEIDYYLDKLNIEGIYSHLSSAETSNDFTLTQLELFDSLTKKYDLKKHILNSAGFDAYYDTKYVYDFVRIGISLYGGEDNEYKVYKPLMKFMAKIVNTKVLDNDAYISYDRTYLANKGDVLGVIAAGYADGLNRKLSNKGQVYLNNKYYDIVGNVCMDMAMIKIDDINLLNKEVEIFGDNITVLDVAKIASTINYEIMTSINKRVLKIYKGE